MSEIIINDWEPSEELVRRWAYDGNIVFIDPDVDGDVLMSACYVPVLLELADDPKCPAQKCVTSILDGTFRATVAWRDFAGAAAIAKTVETVKPSKNAETQELIRYFCRMHPFLAYPRRLLEEIALQLAHDLLIGPQGARYRQVERTGGMSGAFAEYHAYANNQHEFLYLNHATGIWEPPERRRRALEVTAPITIIKISRGPAALEDIVVIEAALGARLPEDYRQFLLRHDGGGVDEHFQYYSIPDYPAYGVHITDFWSAGRRHGPNFTLAGELAYAKSKFANWPDWLLPIGRSGSHDLAIAFGGPQKGAVFLTGQTLQDLYQVAASFAQFFDGLGSLEEVAKKSK